MDRTPKSQFSTLLRYTYRANIVFFAGFAAWYVMKGQQEPELPRLEEKKNPRSE